MNDRFIVPQFISIENKILGPITVRQFVVMLAGSLFIFLSYQLSDFSLFILQTVIIIILVVLFAFVRLNGAPFHLFALNFIETFKKPKIRVWRKEHIKTQIFMGKNESKNTETIIPRKKILSSGKLSELSLIIDTGGAYKGEQEANKINNLSFQ